MVASSSASEGHLNVKAFREWHRQANIMTEVLWNDVRRNLPKKKKTELAELPSHVLECVNDEVKCNKCGVLVTRNAAVDHLQQSTVDLPTEGTNASAAEVAAADEGPTGAETLPEHASGEEQVDQRDAANGSDNSVEQEVNF
ncbi:hypothetical protein MTO96_049874 [Rhipicephalus appendiculatus]